MTGQPLSELPPERWQELWDGADHGERIAGIAPGPDGSWRLIESERHELARLRQEVTELRKRRVWALGWRPGMGFPEDMADFSRADVEADYQAGVDRLAREEQQRREARRLAEAQEEAQARGGRKDMSWTDLTELPKPVWVTPGLLTIGWHGLAGPPEAGKSLLARNWLCEIAASGRNVLYVLSEGQFDLEDRFRAHHQITDAQPHLFFLDGGLNLASASDVAWLCETYRARQPALIVLDMIYGFGLPDDNGVQGVAPVINGGKKIAADLSCAVVAVGHPGLGGERRFRGSSMWRGSFDTEWHMADGTFSCEKHKYADRRALSWAYSVSWPGLDLLGEGEVLDRMAVRMTVIAEDFALFPKSPDAERARRVSARMGVGVDRARALIRAWRNSQI